MDIRLNTMRMVPLFGLIVLGSALLSFVLHGLLSPLTASDVSTFAPSIFVKSDTLILAIAVWEVLAFSVFALIYLAIKDRLPGKPWANGLFYGLSVGGLWRHASKTSGGIMFMVSATSAGNKIISSMPSTGIKSGIRSMATGRTQPSVRQFF